MKKKLLIVAGAGSSLELGMPSVAQIDKLFMEWSKEIYSLTEDDTKSLYTYVREQLEEYYSNCPKKGLIKSVNFEEILYTLLQISSISGDEYHKNPLSAFFKPCEFPSIYKFRHEHVKPSAYDFFNLASYLVDKLLKEFRIRCQKVQIEEKSKFKIFKNFMESLNDVFEIGIITPNYDNLFKQALPYLHTGFDEKSGEFKPELVYGKSGWGFCYQIHGSVHFDQVGNRYDMHAIGWQNDLDSNFKQNSSGRNSQTTMEGASLPTSVIVAGFDKSNQIKRSPFRSYFSQVERYALEADAFLFLGYGFADLHLNKCFESVRNSGQKRPVVVIGWSSDDEDPMQFRRDDWSNNLSATIPYDASKMSYKDYCIAPSIGELKSEGEFEVSKDPNHPLAIWHNGFLNSCGKIEKIKEILQAQKSANKTLEAD